MKFTFANSGPFINNHMLSEVWEEITYPSVNFNGCTVEV